ncbi:MAG: hypothetical protein KJ069_22625 [Anaerolineae bacterium]|nr:hypothetical protein [Anaerolineae bacterium]
MAKVGRHGEDTGRSRQQKTAPEQGWGGTVWKTGRSTGSLEMVIHNLLLKGQA